jgi:hypothetical protein
MDDALELGVKRNSNWWQEMAVFFDKKLMRWRSSRVGASMDHHLVSQKFNSSTLVVGGPA